MIEFKMNDDGAGEWGRGSGAEFNETEIGRLA
jgi:hypothetical protein